MKTKNGGDVMVDLKAWLIITMNYIGYIGGLVLFWKNSVKVDVKFFDKNLIDFNVQSETSIYFVSCVNLVEKERKKLWERLSRILNQRKIPGA